MLGFWASGKCELPNNGVGIGNPRADYFEREICGCLLEEEVDSPLRRTFRKDVVERIGREFEFNDGRGRLGDGETGGVS